MSAIALVKLIEQISGFLAIIQRHTQPVKGAYTILGCVKLDRISRHAFCNRLQRLAEGHLCLPLGIGSMINESSTALLGMRSLVARINLILNHLSSPYPVGLNAYTHFAVPAS